VRRCGKIIESHKNYFDSGLSLSGSGAEGATEVEEREETADPAGVVGDGAVADSIVVVGAVSVEEGSEVECPNTFDRRLVNIPMMDITLCCSQSPTASPLFELLPHSTLSTASSDGAFD
jgi:hypothetical protein